MADSINTVGGNTNVNNERVIKSNKPQGEEAASRAQESDNGVRSVEVELSDEIRQAEERAVFDEARVKEMRDAIEAGTFPLDSRRIAENFAELESLISQIFVLTDTESIAEVLNLARTLSSILEEEFAVLESKDLEALESIQDHKVTVLQQLDSAWSNLNAHREAASEEQENPASQDSLWEEAIGLINNCKEAHIRNDLLLKKQLEVVRNVLSAITKKSDTGQGDLYDKMGRIGKKR